MHTPDYFVASSRLGGWVECKTSEDLENLALKSPNRYCRDSERQVVLSTRSGIRFDDRALLSSAKFGGD